MSLELVQEDLSMAEDERGEETERIPRQGYGRRETDKPPGVWQDPKTWMTAFGLLLTLTLWISTRVLDEIKTINSNITTLNLTTAKTLTAQDSEIKHLTKQQDLESAFIRDQNAYNNNVVKTLTEIVTTMKLRGFPTPNVPEPPKLGGQ